MGACLGATIGIGINGGAVTAQTVGCGLALALAVDVSGSVDAGEYDIQMRGLAAALRDGIVVQALLREQAELTLVQWAGMSRQQATLPWVQMQTIDDLERFASAVEQDPRQWFRYSTAIGEALDYTANLFSQVPECRRRVIDVSGDGPSNEGIKPQRVLARLRAADITVNAVVIDASDDDLTAYFWENVITGAGAFVVTAEGFADYPERIRRKLIRETSRQLSQQ